MQWPPYLRVRPIQQWPGEFTRTRKDGRMSETVLSHSLEPPEHDPAPPPPAYREEWRP